MNASRFPLTIYYDASCPLCATEMHALRDQDHACRLRLVDCSAPGFDDSALAAGGFPRELLMRRIHARDAAGEWYSGVDVFVLAYRGAGIEPVARAFAHPWLRPVWDRLYPWIAHHRTSLSRLHLTGIVAWFVRRSARRSLARAERCSGDAPCKAREPSLK
jgi:predicted DCC family thiol-disulfide oxidoreductase YuxK